MKLAVLYTELAGYLVACLETYRAQTGAAILVCARPPESNAPFSGASFTGLGQSLDRSQLSLEEIEAKLKQFQPEAVLVSGWSDPVYVHICRRLKAAGVPVIAGCDTQWRGSFRQRLAARLAPWYVQRFIDVLWVTGERQRQLAAALGYRGQHCWDGFYACDWKAFSGVAEVRNHKFANASRQTTLQRGERGQASDPSFLFVGRYVEAKGIRDLAKAYQIYRSRTSNPWRLVCAGKGELGALLIDASAEDRGFIQPERLPELMRTATAFVLPSRFEPWGVVIQEAAAAGLPLIVTESCGAGVHLVRNGYNGFVAESGNENHLAITLARMHELSGDDQVEFGRRSLELSKQYTPERWSQTLREGLELLRDIPAGS